MTHLPVHSLLMTRVFHKGRPNAKAGELVMCFGGVVSGGGMGGVVFCLLDTDWFLQIAYPSLKQKVYKKNCD